MCPSRLTRYQLIAEDHPNNVEENEPNPEINVEPQETHQPLRRSQRNRQPINFDDYYTYLNEADFDLGKCNDPESFEDAITCDQSAHWREAMEDELNSIKKTFGNLLNYQRVQNPLDASGSSRPNLTQMGILSDTKLVWLRKAHFDLELHQMDVKTAFLNGDLHEDVYMAQPQASNNIDLLHESTHFLSRNFDMKDLGEASFNMQHCSPTVAPVIKGDVFGSYQCLKTEVEYEEMRRIPYASVVGSLTYAQVCTPPDIAYICGMLGRSENLEVIGYLDLDFEKCKDTSRSSSGYIFKLSGRPISWKSHKQVLTMASTTMAEYAIKEYCDNNAAVSFSNNNSSTRAVYTSIQNPLTKGLPPKEFQGHVAKMGFHQDLT
ncbi:putative zinc finger, CCHC-type containing protein [Tanacetum coccineum]